MVVKASVRRVSTLGVIVMLLALFLSACASKFVSPAQPTSAQLSCSSGEGPIAERYYEGTFKWVCGPLPCPADKEAVWKPISGSEDTAGLWGLRSSAGVQKVSFTCASHCDSDEPRDPHGGCQGAYFLHSRIEDNTLIITALIIPPGSHAAPSNFKPTSSKDAFLRIPGVRVTVVQPDITAVTDAKGEARFDLASEPSRHLVENIDPVRFMWKAQAEFRDGRRAETSLSPGESQVAKEKEAQLQAQADAKRKERELANAGDDAKRQELDGQCSSGNAESCYAVALNLCWPGWWPGAAEPANLHVVPCARVSAAPQALPYFHKGCALNHQQSCNRESKMQSEQQEVATFVEQRRACESGCFDDHGKPRHMPQDSASKVNNRLAACKKACDSPLCTRNPTSIECRTAQQAAWMSVR
jgi:hypothetical protein